MKIAVVNSFMNDGLSKNGRGCCAVSCFFIGFISHFVYEFCTHILGGVF